MSSSLSPQQKLQALFEAVPVREAIQTELLELVGLQERSSEQNARLRELLTSLEKEIQIDFGRLVLEQSMDDEVQKRMDEIDQEIEAIPSFLDRVAAIEKEERQEQRQQSDVEQARQALKDVDSSPESGE